MSLSKTFLDGTGGCDGCLDWRGVGARLPHIFDEEDWYTFEPVNTTDNNGLEETVAALELIYTTIDWPFKVARKLNNKTWLLCFVIIGASNDSKFKAIRKISSRLLAVRWFSDVGESS